MKDLDRFLRENAPETPEEGQFLIETNARLDSVEGIKKTVDGENRRWRVALIIALAAGLVLGCIITLIVMFYPVQPARADVSAVARAVESLRDYKEALMGAIAFCAVALGLLLMSRKCEAL
ncbi:MAG: hypothetical protein IKH60_03020 [Bacteroidales bacterium]|nr:hypothetical protein [Bacteroidales bacterium]